MSTSDRLDADRVLAPPRPKWHRVSVIKPDELYGSPDVYATLFGPADDEEVDFHFRLLANRRRILELGCGAGRLSGPLSARGARMLGIDLQPAMLEAARQADPGGSYIRADMCRLPLADACVDGIISGLLSVAYVTEAASQRALAGEIHRVARAGAPIVLDLPVAWKPASLQGVEEHAWIGELHYAFRYLDLREENAHGAILYTLIEATTRGRALQLSTPVQVFTPTGVAEWLGLPVRFAAPHDHETLSAVPPPDCRRAMVVSAAGSAPSGPRHNRGDG